MKELVKKLTDSLLDAGFSFQGKTLKQNGKPKKNPRDTLIFQIREIHPEAEIWNRDYEKKIALQVETSLKNKAEEEENSERELDGAGNLNYRNLEIFVDITSNEKFVFNRKRKEISPDISYEFFEDYLAKNDLLKDKSLNCMIGKEIYDPTDYRRIYPLEIEDVSGASVVNSYKSPEWRLNKDGSFYEPSEEEIEGLECPSLILEFLHHLFPNDEHRDYVYFWVRTAITSKCQTYLVLNGTKGAGKNLFFELLTHLVGGSNSSFGPRSAFTSHFNSFLLRKQIVFYDEIKIENGSHLDCLKNYINDFINAERKGVDANRVYPLHASGVIANNKLSDLFFHWDERRFSMPEISRIRLDFVWPEEKIQKLRELFKDSSVMRDFGFWIIHKAVKGEWQNSISLKTKRFYDVVFYSLEGWKRALIEEIVSGKNKEISAAELKTMVKMSTSKEKSNFVHFRKIKQFLINYRHGPEAQELGVWKNEETFFVNDVYCKKDENTSEEIDEFWDVDFDL